MEGGRRKYFLSDYSISKNLDSLDEHDPLTGEAKYLAQELVQRDEDSERNLVDFKKADVFALGLCVIDLVIGLIIRGSGASWRGAGVQTNSK
jgi:hypothetical protein